MKALVWLDHRPDSFPEPAWSAQTPFGFYNIEEVSASDSPAYVVRLLAHHFIADKDDLNDAKAAVQADYERRIRSALMPQATVPAIAACREALEFYADPANWIDTPSYDGDPSCITPKAIPVTHEDGRPCDCGDTAREALKALAARPVPAESIKSSDGGVEGHARQCGPADMVNASKLDVNHMTDAPLDAKAGDAQEAGIKPGPSETCHDCGFVDPCDERCPNCNDANEYGDYEGPACEVCGGNGKSAHFIADALERTTQSMARECKVGMSLWNGHSNACLNAVYLLRNIKPAAASEAAQEPVAQTKANTVKAWAAWHPVHGFGVLPNAFADIDDAIEAAKCNSILDGNDDWKAAPVEIKRIFP